MLRKSPHLLLLAAVLITLLAACSSELVKDVYTAAGDGTQPADLTKTTTFRGDDDLNVVVRLNAHNRELEVSATFTGPAGDVYATDPLEADEAVGEVLLGLDWEAQGAVLWTPGEWRVDVYVDNKLEKTVHFTVTETAAPTG